MKNITLIKKSMLLLTLLGCSISGWGEVSISVNGVQYNILTNEAQVSGLADRTLRRCVIPSTITYKEKVYPVTSIYGSYMTEIGAFNQCTNLDSVELPASITTIGEGAFVGCSNLRYIALPPSNCIIKTVAFAGCSALKEITLPSNLTQITVAMFTGCTNLKSITIPQSVTSIMNSAFSGCTNLSTVALGNPDAVIASNAFENTAWLNGTSDGAIYMGNTLYGYKGSIAKGETVTIKAGTTRINENVFSKLPDLTNLEVPTSVTYIGANAFKNTAWLKNQADGIVYAGNVAYTYKGSMPADDSLRLESTTIGIADSAFANEKELSAVELPSSLKLIGDYAFSGCDKLQHITIPSSVTSMNLYYAFGKSSNLTDCYVTWTTIPEFAEYEAGTGLRPASPFQKCTLHVPDNMTATYKSTSWGELFSKITDPTLVGISTAKATDDISVTGKVVTSHRAQTVSLYDLTGRCLTTQKLSAGESLTLPSGTVIVKTEKESVICQ